MRRNTQAAPVQDKPKPEDNRLRCNRCKDEGCMLGTMLSEVTISVRFPDSDKPNEDIAKMWPCCKCGYGLKRWLIQSVNHPNLNDDGYTVIPSTAEKYNITGRMIARCLKAFPKCTAFTLDELRTIAAPIEMGYTDYTEPKEGPELPL